MCCHLYVFVLHIVLNCLIVCLLRSNNTVFIYFSLHGLPLHSRMWIQAVTDNLWITKKHLKLSFQTRKLWVKSFSQLFVLCHAVCQASHIWHVIRIKQTKKLWVLFFTWARLSLHHQRNVGVNNHPVLWAKRAEVLQGPQVRMWLSAGVRGGSVMASWWWS